MFWLLLCILNIVTSEVSVFSQKNFLQSVSLSNQSLAQLSVTGYTEREGFFYAFLFLKYLGEKKQLNLSTDTFNMIIDDYFPLYPTVCKRFSVDIPTSYFQHVKICSFDTIELGNVTQCSANKSVNIFLHFMKDYIVEYCLLDLKKKIIKANFTSGDSIIYYLPIDFLNLKEEICGVCFSEDLMNLYLTMNVSREFAHTKEYHEKKLFLPLALWYKKNSEILRNK